MVTTWGMACPLTPVRAQDNIERVFYVVAMRRDPRELNPLLAWRIMELHMQASVATW